MSHTDRVVLLVDMDCFYCQVEEKLNPALKGKPLAVVQYKAWRGGGIIAVNYPARDRGVTRYMRGDEAKRKCPEIVLVRVPTVREKADLTKYREAGKSVARVLQMFTPLIERASVDEAYLDITDAVNTRLKSLNNKQINLSDIKNTFMACSDTMDFLYNLYEGGLHLESNLKLACGALITEEIRAAVFEQTGYTCSAGIAHNKILAKLACGLNKPNKQTILPQDNVLELYKELPVRKIRSLGGKFGNTLSEDLGITNMAELLKFTEKDLQKRYEDKVAVWLYNIARGINHDPVTTRLVSKSIGCCKNFPGKSALIEPSSVAHWLNEFALEMVERLEQDLEENNRKAKQMVVSFSQETKGVDVTGSRAHPLSSYNAKKIASDAFEVLRKNCLRPTGTFCLKYLGISAGKFEECKNVNEITSFFPVLNSDMIETKTCNVTDNHFEPPLKDAENEGSFSDTTEELDEDSATPLVFFGEDQTEDHNNVTNSDNDSISNELVEENEVQQPKESFFLRYFESLKAQSEDNAVSRDFDTSLALDELDTGNSGSENETNDVSHVDHLPGPSHSTTQSEDIGEVCGECGKKIEKSEMLSHIDYHFALKLVREESKLYKTENRPSANAKQNVKKSQKRKFAAVERNNTSLMSFLRLATAEAGENFKQCPHCSKQIELAQFQSHLDYHVAKKLHVEINPVKCISNNLKQNVDKRKAKPKQTKNNINTMTAFLKQS